MHPHQFQCIPEMPQCILNIFCTSLTPSVLLQILNCFPAGVATMIFFVLLLTNLLNSQFLCCLGAVWVSCSVAKATASDFPFPVLLCFPEQSPSCGDCLLQALLFFCGVRCRHPRVLQTLARLTQPKRRSRQRQLTIRPSKSWWKCLLPWAVPSMPCCSTAGAGSWPGGCQLAKQH